MPPDPASSNRQALSHFQEWTGSLACPACHGALRAEADSILCIACSRRYPILDGIPVLIPDRATRSED